MKRSRYASTGIITVEEAAPIEKRTMQVELEYKRGSLPCNMTAVRFVTASFVTLLGLSSLIHAASKQPACTNPSGDCATVLVIPVKYPDVCPNPTLPCVDHPEWVIDPPRLSASELDTLLNQSAWDFYHRWSNGTWNFNFLVLKDPTSSDGWWAMPESLQTYYVDLVAGSSEFQPVGKGHRAIVQDAVEHIAWNAYFNGTLPGLWNFNRILVIDNQQGRGGKTVSVSYDVPVVMEYPIYHLTPHLFSASWVAVDVSDQALVSLVTHEVGHQLGLGGGGDFYGTCHITETPLPPFDDECNGPWDVMAWDSAGPNHPTAYTKSTVGWIPEDPAHVEMLPLPGSSMTTTVQLYPSEDLDDENHARLLRIPFIQTESDGEYYGYSIECRRPINGDEQIPTHGVLIQIVQESDPGVAVAAGMPARIIRADNSADPFGNYTINEATLASGDEFVDADRRIIIRFDGYGGTGPFGPCNVTVVYEDTGGMPDPAIDYNHGNSPDLWLDSPLNGLGLYPPNQVVDADGAPIGPGDYFSNATTGVRVDFRVRNRGTVSQPAVRVRIDVRQPPEGPLGCGEGPFMLTTIGLIPPLAPGEAAIGGIPLNLSDKLRSIHVRATILPEFTEINPNNDVAERTFVSSAMLPVTSQGLTKPGSFESVFDNRCGNTKRLTFLPQQLPSMPGSLPDPASFWSVTDLGLLQLDPGRSVAFNFTVTPPDPCAPGTTITIPFTASTASASVVGDNIFGGATFNTVARFPVTFSVVSQSTLTLQVGSGPYVVGKTVSVTGQLTPAITASVVAIRAIGPGGEDVLHTVATDAAGAFNDALILWSTGTWTLKAFWVGDDRRQEAESSVQSFGVVSSVVSCVSDSDCDDGNPCTSDTCTSRSGVCVYQQVPDGARCGDADPCTIGEACLAGVCGTHVTCDDGSACTVDICDPYSAGTCRHTPAVSDEVSTLQFATATSLQWARTRLGIYWNTYRGTIPSGLMASRLGIYDHLCHEIADSQMDGPTVSTVDIEPPVGSAFYFLVSEETTCGEGTLGTSSLGLQLPNRSPCPTSP